MNWQRVRTLAKRVIIQMIADRRTLVLIVVMPMLLLTVASLLIRVEPGAPVIGIVNQDEGITLGERQISLGDRITTILQDMGELEVMTLTPEEAEEKLKNAEVDAVIVMSPDFSSNVVQNRELALHVDFEGSNPMLSDRMEQILERIALQAVNSLALLSTATIPTGTGGGSNIEVSTTMETTYLHSGPEYDTLDYMAPALIAFFVFFFVFLLTSVSFLRERLAGTLERLQATPIRSHEIIIGYMLGFLLFALLQGAVTLLFTVYVINIHYAGNLLVVFIVEALLAMTSVNLGIFLSTFARNEFQVLQFIPLVVTSQGLLGGLIWEVEDMPEWLQVIARLMPLTYANQALREVMINGAGLSEIITPILALVIIAAVFVLFSARTAGRVRM